jgi:predicted adenine nucleotide alpha hydrolase (AANH) superfamily ATPase
MVIDSYDLFKQFINEKRDIKPTLLLHCCCAPCSSYVLELLKDVFDITIYYYNPNIYPLEEYDERLKEFEKLGNFKIIKADFEPQDFYQAVKGLESIPEGGERCFACYNFRLQNAAIVAKERAFDYFSTTLSISPYKNSYKINEIGQKLADQYGVKFLYSNFKKNEGYKRSIEICKNLEIYRQDYCGCIFSWQASQEKHK